MKDFRLPDDVKYRTKWLIKGYYRIKDRYYDKLMKSPNFDGQPRGTQTGDPTGQAVVRVFEESKDISAIERGLTRIPEEYQDAIWDNYMFGTKFPDLADVKTYKKWKQRYTFYVACYRGWWEEKAE